MKHITCHCGHNLVIIGYAAQNEGILYFELEEEQFANALEAEVRSYLSAITSGQQHTWLETHQGKNYPQDMSEDSLIYDLITRFELEYSRSLVECPRCGSLYMQKEAGSDEYTCYTPYNQIT